MRAIAGFLVALLLAGGLRAQDTLTPGKPADVRMSEETLRAATKLFKVAVARDDLRGVVLLVARNRKIVVHEAHGWRDEAKQKPMRKESLFRMASNSKAVTAAGILALADEGKLSLDDPVCKHMPAFDNAKGKKITIRHLLTHTAGLRIGPIFLRPLIKKSENHPNAPNLQVEVARFGEIGAEKEPGTTYAYSNAGYNTLAALIEIVSRKPFKAYLRDKIYKPLAMADSCNHESDADHARMSTIFRRPRGRVGWNIGWKPGDAPDYPFPRGSGGMISTARDYAVFCQMYLNGGTYGGQRILSEKIAASATRSHTFGISKTGGYGFGWMIARQEGYYSHGGSDGTWGWVDPKRNIIGLVFTQSPGGPSPRDWFRKLVTDACQDK